jgi:sugar fermentation stimulation protein A
MKYYKFKKELQEALIVNRPNRFIMEIMINGKKEKAHCPSTGRIGNFDFKNTPCLVSESDNKTRKTKFTVEAVSSQIPKKVNKK